MRNFSKTIALAVGVASTWPLVYMVIFMFMFSLLAGDGAGRADTFEWLFICHTGTMLLMMALLVFYIRDVFRNSALRDEKRTLWAVVLFMGAPIAMPVYWWHYVWQPSVASSD
jgi:hypothetical protein